MVSVTVYRPSASFMPCPLCEAGSTAQPLATPQISDFGNGSPTHSCGYGEVAGLLGEARSGL